MSVSLEKRSASSTGEGFSLFSLPRFVASLAYGLVTGVRNFFFDRRIFSPYRSTLPVICVGNVTVGGTGKTPFVRYLVEYLRSQGETPVVLSRGYGGTHAGPYLVRPEDSAAEIGDEPKMLSSDTALPVVIARSRALGAQFIEREKLGSIIVLDDGYQHRWLARDLNIVCINVADDNACRAFADGRLLPAGIFRENRKAALERASLIVLSARKVGEIDRSSPAWHALENAIPAHLPRVTTVLQQAVVSSIEGAEELSAQDIAALCAIANPQGFFSTLEQLDFRLIEQKALPDHSPDIEDAVARCLAETSLPVIVTEKDAVKLSASTRRDQRVYVLRFTLDVKPKDQLVQLVAKVLSRC